MATVLGKISHPTIITTSDYTHADYIVRCLDRKVSCLVEKPLCINAQQCQAIWEAQKRNHEHEG